MLRAKKETTYPTKQTKQEANKTKQKQHTQKGKQMLNQSLHGWNFPLPGTENHLVNRSQNLHKMGNSNLDAHKTQDL